jgi:hypothetical protein
VAAIPLRCREQEGRPSAWVLFGPPKSSQASEGAHLVSDPSTQSHSRNGDTPSSGNTVWYGRDLILLSHLMAQARQPMARTDVRSLRLWTRSAAWSIA